MDAAEDSREQIEQAIEISQRLTTDFPTQHSYRMELAEAHGTLAVLLFEKFQTLEDARVQFDLTVEQHRILAEQVVHVATFVTVRQVSHKVQE